jgi:hypothetical protein
LKKTEKKVLSTKGKVFLCFRLTCEGPLIFSLSRNNADDKVTALFKLQGGTILFPQSTPIFAAAQWVPPPKSQSD